MHTRLDTDLDDLVNDKNGHEKDDGKDIFFLFHTEKLGVRNEELNEKYSERKYPFLIPHSLFLIVFFYGDDSLEVLEVDRLAFGIA